MACEEPVKPTYSLQIPVQFWMEATYAYYCIREIFKTTQTLILFTVLPTDVAASLKIAKLPHQTPFILLLLEIKPLPLQVPLYSCARAPSSSRIPKNLYFKSTAWS